MLEVAAIDLHYGAAQALRAVSLSARLGEVTCVLGRNGVGKTSLLRALVGQHPISRGAIRLDGHDITRLPPHERARGGIAYVPQGREIFPLLTVEENLKTGFAPLKRDERVVPDDIFSLFPVLGEMLRRRGGDLSGGQQQQLAIARALIAAPRVLLLDEPSLGLAPLVVREIFDILRSLNEDEGLTILVVEQNANVALDGSDEGYVLESGRVALSGSSSELRADESVRRSYLGY
jgi:urea transport system ATP-binding protein